MTEITPVLSVIERKTWRELETAIKRGLIGSASALKEIQINRYYREAFPNFETYCQYTFGFTRQQAYSLIGLADTAAEMSNFLDKNTPVSHYLELAKVDPDNRLAVYEQANDLADAETRNVTAKDIRKAAAPLTAEKPPVNYDFAKSKARALAAVEILTDRIAQLHDAQSNENALAEAKDQIRYLTQIVTDWE